MLHKFSNLSAEQASQIDPAVLLPHCSVAKAAALVADAWTVLVLRELFWGASRYDELQRHTGMASNVLAARLKKLTDAGVITKQCAPDDARRYDYRLSKSGQALFPVLMSLMAWGDEHSPGPHGALVVLRHRDCGQVTQAGTHCSACAHPLTHDGLDTEINLAYTKETQ